MSEQKTLNRLSSPQRKEFEGEFVKLKELVNCEFIVHDFMGPVKHVKYGEYFILQLEVEKEKRIAFTSSKSLMDILKENSDNLPAIVELGVADCEAGTYYYFK